MPHGLEVTVSSRPSHPHHQLSPRGLRADLPPARGTAPVPDTQGLAQGAHKYISTTSRATSLLKILLFTSLAPRLHEYPAAGQSSSRQGRPWWEGEKLWPRDGLRTLPAGLEELPGAHGGEAGPSPAGRSEPRSLRDARPPSAVRSPEQPPPLRAHPRAGDLHSLHGALRQLPEPPRNYCFKPQHL